MRRGSFQTTTTTFAEVAVYGRRTGPCKFCGKHCKRHQKFFQTLNPFNKNSYGIPKSREEIRAELMIERNKWESGQPSHVKCEDLGIQPIIAPDPDDDKLPDQAPESRLIKAAPKENSHG